MFSLIPKTVIPYITMAVVIRLIMPVRNSAKNNGPARIPYAPAEDAFMPGTGVCSYSTMDSVSTTKDLKIIQELMWLLVISIELEFP